LGLGFGLIRARHLSQTPALFAASSGALHDAQWSGYIRFRKCLAIAEIVIVQI